MRKQKFLKSYLQKLPYQEKERKYYGNTAGSAKAVGKGEIFPEVVIQRSPVAKAGQKNHYKYNPKDGDSDGHLYSKSVKQRDKNNEKDDG